LESSSAGEGVGVSVGVDVRVGVRVGVDVLVEVRVGVRVRVRLGVEVECGVDVVAGASEAQATRTNRVNTVINRLFFMAGSPGIYYADQKSCYWFGTKHLER